MVTFNGSDGSGRIIFRVLSINSRSLLISLKIFELKDEILCASVSTSRIGFPIHYVYPCQRFSSGNTLDDYNP
jgi:hypothetical protein